jgi:hypothetical protein
MELDINRLIAAALESLPQSGSYQQTAAVEELKIQVKQALLQVTLETNETIEAVEKWARIRRAMLPAAMKTQPLRTFCSDSLGSLPTSL